MRSWKSFAFLVCWLPTVVWADALQNPSSEKDVIIEVSVDERRIVLLTAGVFELSDQLQIGSTEHSAIEPEVLRSGMSIAYIAEEGEIHVIQILSKVPSEALAH